VTHFLALYTNRTLLLRGEPLKILCRVMTDSGIFMERIPEVRLTVVPGGQGEEQSDQRERRSWAHDARMIRPQQASGGAASLLETDGLPADAYTLVAQDPLLEGGGTVERDFFVAGHDEYKSYWQEVAGEELSDVALIRGPADLLETIRHVITLRRDQHPDAGLTELEFTLYDRRARSPLQSLGNLQKAPYEWFHFHLLQAAYDKVFYGGKIDLSLLLESAQVTTRVLLTSRTGGMDDRLPAYFSYVAGGLPVELRFEAKLLSDHQLELVARYPQK